MAIRLEDEYPLQTTPADANYPHGSARNVAVPGDGLGTPWEKALVNDIYGFLQALLAEGSISPSGSPDTALVSQYIQGVYAATMNAEYTPLSGPAISLSGYLDRQGIWAETETAIQQANDYLVSQGDHDVIHIPPKTSVTISSGISLNSVFAGLDGHGSTLDASGVVATLTALDVIATATPSVDRGKIENLSIIGNGKAIPITGIDLRNASHAGLGMARVILQNVMVGECYIGVNCGSAPGVMQLEEVNISDCGTALRAIGTSPVNYCHGRMAGNDLALYISSADASVQMFGAKLHNNGKLISSVGGMVDLFGCRLSAAGYSATPITITTAGSAVAMHGGVLEVDTATFDYWVNVGAGTFFRSTGVRHRGTKTATGIFSTGSGRVVVEDTKYDDPAELCTLVNLAYSLLADGGFGEAALVDDIFLTRDASTPIQNRLSWGACNAFRSTIDPHSGTGSLYFTKDAVTGTEGAIAAACVPVRGFDRVVGEFWYRRLSSGSVGTIYARYKFAKMGVNAYGVPVMLHEEEITSQALPSATDSGWLKVSLPGFLVAPSWATHFVLEIDGYFWDNSGTSGWIKIDDINLGVLG